jgi:sortase (surface protein transpeptidase)
MADRRAAVSLALGALLLVGTPVAWHLTRPPAQVGDVTTASADAQADEPTATAREPGPADGDPAPGDRVSRNTDAAARDGDEPSDAAEEPAPVPVRVRIPAIGADAPVDPVGLEPAGGMELPDDVTQVGWYEPGVSPGGAGSAVLAGHVDSRTQGPGALFRLRELDVDDEIELDTDAGTQRWRVVARASYPKQALPIEELFVWDGPPRLVVITCGGEFDAASGSYEENVVVHAVPA